MVGCLPGRPDIFFSISGQKLLEGRHSQTIAGGGSFNVEYLNVGFSMLTKRYESATVSRRNPDVC